MLHILILMLACGDSEKESDTGLNQPSNEPSSDTTDCMVGTVPDDMDCDGYTVDDGDCDDTTALVYPGATEIPYDGRDNDCAGDGDWNDIDGDGYVGIQADGGDDCDDNNPNAYPGATEICYDGIDQDCAGDVEAENNNDCDGDGFIGRGTGATDCNDEDPTANPDAEEIWYDGFDQNCDGQDDFDQDGDGDPIAVIDVDGDGIPEDTWDANNDGFFEYEGGTDCDDTQPLTSPLLNELWDEVDRDCDGEVDGLVARDSWARFETFDAVAGGTGMSAAVLGDITGDGIAEIIVGAPYSVYDLIVAEDGSTSRDNYHGAVYVLDPTNIGSPATVNVANIEGGQMSYFGWDLVDMGDLDGAGSNDILIGSPGHNKAFLVLGETFAAGGNLTLADAHANIVAVGFGGVDVANIGDINGDGIAEAAIGGSFVYSNSSAWVGVWDGATMGAGTNQGPSDVIFKVDSASGSIKGGETVGGVDFDGDGLSDMAVAFGVTGSGKVAMVSGADIAQGGSVAHADLTSVNGGMGTEFGRHNAVAEDIDGDGYAELITSAGYANATPSDGSTYNGGGIVYVIDGDDLMQGGLASSASYIQIHGTETAGNLQVIDQLGDYDGDGITDIVVSRVNEDFVSNIPEVKTFMFRGSTLQSGGSFDETDALSSIFSNQYSNDMFGYSGSSGDLDGDGDDDLIIGAPRAGYVIGAGALNFSGSYGLGNVYVFRSDLQ